MAASASASSTDDHSYSAADAQSVSPREKRFQGLKIKHERLRYFLLHGRNPPGMSSLEARNVRNQGRMHVLDATKQVIYYTGGKADVKKKLVCDIDEVTEILIRHHSNPMGGHRGINGTLATISQYYVWNGMKEDIVRYISSCERCQKRERGERVRLKVLQTRPSLEVTEALEVVGMHLIGPLPASSDGHQFVLAFTDCYTKFVDLFPLKAREATCVASAIRTFVCRWGAPRRLLFDQGQEFVAQVNGEICKTLHVARAIVTDSSRLRACSVAECDNQTVTSCLRELAKEHQADWPGRLEELAYSLRTQEQPSTKCSPFLLMFGRHPRSSSEMDLADVEMGIAVDNLVSTTETADTDSRQQVGAQMEASQCSDVPRSRLEGMCLETACDILRSTAEFESLKYRTESTEDNEYIVITRDGSFGVVGLPTDLASVALDRHGKLTFQAAYQPPVEHRLFDGKMFDKGTFCSLLRRLVQMRFCKGIPEAHITDASAHRLIKTLGHPVLRYQAEKCEVFYEQSSAECDRTPYRCVSCKYAIRYLAKEKKRAKQAALQGKQGLTQPLLRDSPYPNTKIQIEGHKKTPVTARRKQQPSWCTTTRPQVLNPQQAAFSDKCSNLQEIVQAISNECNVDFHGVVFDTAGSST